MRARALLAAACALALAGLVAAPPAHAARAALMPKPEASVFDGNVMWIWMLSRAGGSAAAVADRAQRHGIDTVIFKAANDTTYWPQFSPALVSELKARGLNVCGYHFVYGGAPVAEARVSARIVRAGADCLMIDAEGAYEGRYRQAARYVRSLRKRVGPDYPVGLTSFPYVHYHPSFPYSVFLAPGAAAYNLPQMYWRDIGTTVDRIFAIAYRYNRVYKRPIYPLGQLYQNPPASQVRRFRRLAEAYGATGISWWSWQHATATGWRAIRRRVRSLTSFTPRDEWPLLRRGHRSDLVLWAQQHLASAGQRVRLDGVYTRRMEEAVAAFQAENGLFPDGRIGPDTWIALLRYEPKRVGWYRGQPAFARARRR